MVYSPDWTNTGFSFILLTVNLFRHSTLIEQGYLRLLLDEVLFIDVSSFYNYAYMYLTEQSIFNTKQQEAYFLPTS